MAFIISLVMVMAMTLVVLGNFNLLSAAPAVNYLDKIKFSTPCASLGYKYNNYTGYFFCAVPSPDECRKACMSQGCFEWSPYSRHSPFKKDLVRSHRCRCLPEISKCFYNPIPFHQRSYAKWPTFSERDFVMPVSSS